MWINFPCGLFFLGQKKKDSIEKDRFFFFNGTVKINFPFAWILTLKRKMNWAYWNSTNERGDGMIRRETLSWSELNTWPLIKH